MGKRLNCYASGETARECEKIKRRHERNKRKARAKSLANDPKPVWYPFDGNSAVEYHKYLDALTVWERRHPEGDAEPGPKKFEPQKPEPVVAAPPVVAPVAKIITPMPNITLRPAPRVPVREPRKRVGMCCSNPSCLKPTSGPRVDPNKSLNVGFAAHITAASEGGCRYDLSLTSEQRQDIENGIWLCRTCAKLIDSDETRYTVHVLREWKRSAEESAHADVETDYSPRNQVSNEDNEYAGKFSDAIGHLSNIIPRFFMGTPGPVGLGRPAGNAYGLVFPELKLRQRIETFLIHLESANKMQARPVTAAELRLQVVRDTIQAVLDCVDHVKNNDKELATRVHLT